MDKKNQAQAKWIEIARIGRFRDSGGNWHDFSQERLEKMAADYDPQKREAPLVIGHPLTDSPAYGWIKQLKTKGKKLLALPACVTDSVKKAVDNKLYRYVSMRLYQDGGLRHVGLLGGTPPAIDGLAPVSFSNADEESAEIFITFSDCDDENPELIKSQMKGRQMELEELRRQLAEAKSQLAIANQEKEMALKEAASLKEELAKTKTDGEKATAEFAAYRDNQEKGKLQSRIDQLVKDGKVTPAEKEAVAKTAETLRQAAGALSFAQGEDAPLEVYLKPLEERKQSELFGSFSAPEAGTEKAAPAEPLSAKL